MAPAPPAEISTAILFCAGAGTGAGTGPGPAPALVRVLGAPVIEWQVRAVRRAGIGRILLLADPLPEPLATRLADTPALERIAVAADLAAMLSGTVLLLAEGVIIDHRAIAAVLAQGSAPALIQFGKDPPDGAERIDRDSHWAGAALLPATMVAATVQTLGDWDLAATLLRVADAAGARRMDFAAADMRLPDQPDRRLPPPLVWFRPTAASAADIGRRLLHGSACPGPDLADRHIYRPLALALAGMIAPATSGAMLCWLAFSCLVLAVGLMLAGWQWPALILLLLAPLADQCGRILLTARGLPIPRAIPDEAVRTALTALAVACLALPIAGTNGMSAAAPLLAGAALLLLSVLRVFRIRWFRRRTGVHLDVRTGVDGRIFGMMGAATSLTLPLLPFAIAGLWWPGLLLVAGWSALLFVLLEWRFLAAIDASLPPRP